MLSGKQASIWTSYLRNVVLAPAGNANAYVYGELVFENDGDGDRIYHGACDLKKVVIKTGEEINIFHFDEAMFMADIILVPLTIADREQFIKDNQEAFNYGALEEFGQRDDHFEEDEQIISRKTIENSIDSGETYRIMLEGVPVGGVIIKTDGNHGELEILFVSPKVHSKGIGYSAWCAVEKMHPEVTVWETVTPYF